MAGKKNEYVWKDRKRILGLPLTFTRYMIREQRLYYSKGFFNTTEDELLLYRILDIKLNRTFGDKLVGVGTITLFTADKSTPQLNLERIKKPQHVRDLISKMVEDERTRLNIRGKELYGIADNDVGGENNNIGDVDI
jgi:uncharacterized membrane protein YdbT with pleckstrin-like domain